MGQNLLRPELLTGLLCLITAGYRLTRLSLPDPLDDIVRAPQEDISDNSYSVDALLDALRGDLRQALQSASPDLTSYIQSTVIPFFQAKGALDLADQVARVKKLAPNRRISAQPWQVQHLITGTSTS